MAFFRRWSLVLFALLVGAGSSFAASREQRAYDAAVQSFQDRLYPLASSKLAQFLQTYRKSTNAPAAILLLAQAEFHQQKYSATITRLSDPGNFGHAKIAGLADRYLYWQAEAQYASGDFQGAAQTFVTLATENPESPLALTATVEAAAASGKLGLWHRVDELLGGGTNAFQRMARLDPGNEQVANGRLLLAESKYVQRDFAAAISVLNLLTPAILTPGQDWKRAHLLYRANLSRGNLELALVATTNLLEIARAGRGEAWATNLAESVACRAHVLEQEGQPAAAAAALQENLSNTTPAGPQQQAVLKLAELAMVQTNLTEAEAVLEKFLAQFSNSPAAESPLLTLGEMHLADFVAQPLLTNHLAVAQEKLTQLLSVSTNVALIAKASLARGWCFWLAGKYPESFIYFESAAGLLPRSVDLAVARFKMGDAQFALKNYRGAQTNYQAVIADFPTIPEVTNSLAGRALYQILRARLELHEAAGADDIMRQLLHGFFEGAPAESSLLLAGEGFSDFDSASKAREVFQVFKQEHADSPLMPQVAFAIGRTFEREQAWSSAVTNYEAWLQTYPTNELRAQVEYARNWAVSQAGDEPGAFDLFSKFITQYTNKLTPLAHWWVADHYFRLGGTNFVQAELNYELIQDFPTNELTFPAQLMAGRAALGRSGYSDALRYFKSLITTNCPEDLRDKARFGYCETLLRQMSASDTNNSSLLQVTNILAQMTPKSATNIVGALAWSETGDCNIQLGALDAATNAYMQTLKSPMASPELRDRAHVGLGIVFEKKADGSLSEDARKALLDLALENYGKVFYSEAEAGDTFWAKKAGLQMLLLNSKTGYLKGEALDKFIDKLKARFPQLQNSPELKRLALKN